MYVARRYRRITTESQFSYASCFNSQLAGYEAEW